MNLKAFLWALVMGPCWILKGFVPWAPIVCMGGCQNYGPLWVLNIMEHLVFRGPKRGPQF